MSDDVDTQNTETPDAAPKAETKKSDELPDWARKQISDANSEAAKRRVELQTARDENRQLHEQVTTLSTKVSEFETVSSAVQTDFDKLVTAVQTLFPEKQAQVFTFAKTLQGSSGEELANHAADLNKMFGISAGPSPAVDRSQGLGTGAPASDPASEFAALFKSQLGR